MQPSSPDPQDCRWIRILEAAYALVLHLYPKGFRARFAAEMQAVFQDALAESGQTGTASGFKFLLRELMDAPKSILAQHLHESPSPSPKFAHLLFFTLAFLLSGWLEAMEPLPFTQGGWLAAGLVLLVGGLGGIILGANMEPARKTLFAASGSLGFLCAQTISSHILHLALAAPATSASFFLPLLYPVLVGSIYGLFLGLPTQRARPILKLTTLTSLTFLVGFVLNRLFAALMQSFLLHTPTQILAQTGLAGLLSFVLIPYLLQGVLLAITLRKFSQRYSPTPTLP